MTATALYRAFDARGVLLYVGISLSPLARMSEHRRTSPWAPDIARIDIEWLPSRRAAEVAETKAIRSEGPLWNVAKRGDGLASRALPPARLPQGVEVLPSGRFRARFTYRGHAYCRTFDTAKAASAWRERTRIELRAGIYVDVEAEVGAA